MYLFLHFTVTVLENPATSQMSLSVSLVDSLLLFINSTTSPYSDSPSTLYIGLNCDVNWLLVLPQMKARHCLKKNDI
jgi:hypothetical protein